MATIYYADETTKFFKGTNIVDGEYQLKDNETFENPTGKLEPAKLVNGSWIDATPEEHEAYVKAQQAEAAKFLPTNNISVGDKAMNALGVQVAQLTKDNLILTKSVDALGKQLAAMQMNSTKENGGN
ncbi:hypothetical protein K3F51_06700 [Limosilactobacillus reuteri]|jgi:hypothetical protein|uniref:hypothetical protein n=2 Tax=Limosilactobacillus reuteri TaxID=1598 RepID=UPI001261E172|nr:hypothetical protein [Limosilactobacillus reuteri]UAW59501.1 hypothetical protein K3F51_06700 [Limosilactobacillus reuteri]DAY91078.1 MAG TPA: hypothetical protein [Caudoviricetes sp.]